MRRVEFLLYSIVYVFNDDLLANVTFHEVRRPKVVRIKPCYCFFKFSTDFTLYASF